MSIVVEEGVFWRGLLPEIENHMNRGREGRNGHLSFRMTKAKAPYWSSAAEVVGIQTTESTQVLLTFLYISFSLRALVFGWFIPVKFPFFPLWSSPVRGLSLSYPLIFQSTCLYLFSFGSIQTLVLHSLCKKCWAMQEKATQSEEKKIHTILWNYATDNLWSPSDSWFLNVLISWAWPIKSGLSWLKSLAL